MTDLERRALLGDKQAQEECTRQGIVLACPWCKIRPTEDDVIPDYLGWIIFHDCKIAGSMRIKAKSRFDVVLKWNTRPAPPIGRCKDCANTTPGEDLLNHKDVIVCTVYGCRVKENGLCREFEPKGKNQ